MTHTPGQGAYVTVAIEYDLIADSPDNLTPVSWANAAMGAIYDHPSYSKPLLDQADAYYQHNLIKQTTLPITRPIREFGTAVADDQGDVAVNKLVDQLDNVLRPIVDAVKQVGETIKKVADRLTPKANRQ